MAHPLNFSRWHWTVGMVVGLCSSAPCAGQCETPFLANLKQASPAANDSYGVSVAVDGDWAAVGAPFRDVPSSSAGCVMIFHRVAGVWTQDSVWQPADIAAGDEFGIALDMQADTLAIGARGKTNAGFSTGAVYILRRTGTTWAQEGKLTNTQTSGPSFGQSLALDGDALAVGQSNRFSIFVRSGTNWNTTPTGTATGSGGFARDLTMSGGLLACGARLDATMGSSAGAVLAYTVAGGVLSPLGPIYASDAAETDHFGAAVSISGSRMLVGAEFKRVAVGGSTYPGAGVLYAFEWNGAAWVETQKIVDPYLASNTHFGENVALRGDVAVIGQNSSNEPPLGGIAHVLRWNGANWQAGAILRGDDTGNGDAFGSSVAIDGDTVFVGAPDYNGTPSINDVGNAYVFGLDGAPGEMPIKFTSAPSPGQRWVNYPLEIKVVVTGAQPVSYQWKKGGGLMADNIRVTGTQTDTLRFSPLAYADATSVGGSYTCVATNACGNAVSASMLLSVRAGCVGDSDFDGDVDFADVTTTLSLFGTTYTMIGAGPGDGDRDGVVAFDDVTAALANFGTTCATPP